MNDEFQNDEKSAASFWACPDRRVFFSPLFPLSLSFLTKLRYTVPRFVPVQERR